MKRIYLDNNSTTSVDPRVLQVMVDDLSGPPANPSSIHHFGQEARKQITQARYSMSEFFQVKPSELFFTSGGTESLNWILRGFVSQNPKCRIVTSNVEHACINTTLQHLQQSGVDVTYLPVGLWGAVRLQQLEEHCNSNKPDLIILGSVNNETGVKTDIDALARFALEHQIPFVVDAVSHLGKELFHIPRGVAAMAFSGHKIHGPKGVGLAFIRSGFKIAPLITGGNQEQTKRAGTENLSGILGFAKALELLKTELPEASERMKRLRDRLIEGLMQHCGNIVIHGQGPRICNTAHISFPRAEGESLLMQLDLKGVATSHGSACSSGALEPSRILINMGIAPSIARTSLRFSLSRFTTEAEIDSTIQYISELI